MGDFFIRSATHFGLEAYLIRVETDISSGLPSFRVVGLPDAAISESRDRVRAAIKNCGFSFPRTRVTVNLAPAHIKKQGPAFDLAIALGILASEGVLQRLDALRECLIVGELSLQGDVRPTNSVLLASALARDEGIKSIMVPRESAHEAALVKGVRVVPVSTLQEAIQFLNGTIEAPVMPTRRSRKKLSAHKAQFGMEDVKGQEQAKRALEIAAAGSHNILFTGPPGSGKTMLARATPSILPDLSFQEALEITKILSISSSRPLTNLVRVRPFRAPHHSSSSVALIGGGTWPMPGDVSLAHRGILFLDEFPEFPRTAIENLRQPLEDGIVSISRAAGRLEFPAKFMLIAAMNPCPCGYATEPTRACQCTPSQVHRYQQKISGPLLDRIDLALDVPRVDFDKLTNAQPVENSDSIRARVQNAVNRQRLRYASLGICSNSELTSKHLAEFCSLSADCFDLLKQAVARLHLSARAYTRVVKVARTIADLDDIESISVSHLAEALQYRPKLVE